MENIKILDYYSTSEQVTDLSKYSEAIKLLPDDLVSLTQIVQGLIVHDMWLGRYNVTPTDKQMCPAVPSMSDLIDTLVGFDKNEPFVFRNPEQRVVACCREFSVMLCAILRAKGISARARCGFATYLAKPEYREDHWMCEAWNGKKWQRVDPQMGIFEVNSMRGWAKSQKHIPEDYKEMLLDLNPMDLNNHDFILAGEAWQMCRKKEVDPAIFRLDTDPKIYGLDSLSGLWFVRGNLIRDFLALNKIELPPFVSGIERRKDYWDNWRIISAKDNELSEREYLLLDQIATLSGNPDNNLEKIVEVYKENTFLHPPEDLLV